MPDRHPHHRQPEFFTPKVIRTSFLSMGQTIDLVVTTPDLLLASADVWGDWGPMYTCRLNPDQRVRFEYRARESEWTEIHDVAVPTVAVSSPALVWERRQHPFRMEVVDAERGVGVHAWMTPDGAIARVEPRRLWAGLEARLRATADAARMLGTGA